MNRLPRGELMWLQPRGLAPGSAGCSSAVAASGVAAAFGVIRMVVTAAVLGLGARR